MKKLITIAIILIAMTAFAADEALVVPNIFVNGQVADANKVNENFSTIATHINTKLIVPSDYGAPVDTEGEFEQTASPTTLTSVTYTDGVETWTQSDGSKIEHLTSAGDNGAEMTGRREYNTLGVMTQDLTYFPAVVGVDTTEPMTQGTVWSAEYVARKPDGSQYGTENFMYTVTAVETVVVPAGVFLNCIKVFCTGTYNSTSWYAEGVGLVKRIGVQGLMELR